MAILTGQVKPYVNPEDVLAFGKVVSDVAGFTPPAFREKNTPTVTDPETKETTYSPIYDIKGSGQSLGDNILYGIDMANNATMFLPEAQKAAVATRFGRAAPLVNAFVNPSYGATTIKGNLAGAGGVMGATLAMDAIADTQRSDADRMMDAVKSARFRGRYDLADKILDRIHKLDMASDDTRTFSHGVGMGSIAGGTGAVVGGASTLPLNAYRHIAGGSLQRSSKDEGFWSGHKAKLDDRIISLIESGDADGISEALEMYRNQLNAVARGDKSISTIDSRVLKAIDSLGNEKLSGVYGKLENLGARKEAEARHLSLEELERLAAGPKSMRGKTDWEGIMNFRTKNKKNTPTSKGFGHGY